jgi:hypothetical protein
VFLFKGVVQLETQRRENSRRCHALILQMADMMGALLQLSSVSDPELKDERTGQTIVGRIQALMANIEQDITDCGNLIDTYAKHSLPSMLLLARVVVSALLNNMDIFQGKFFFSGQYADKFKARAEGLVVSITGHTLDANVSQVYSRLLRVAKAKSHSHCKFTTQLASIQFRRK